jgi:hypothetical protein
MAPPVKDTRTCSHCHKEKLKQGNFYSPTDNVCIECNADVNFAKLSRKIAREQGVAALRERLEDYNRRARITRQVLSELA